MRVRSIILAAAGALAVTAATAPAQAYWDRHAPPPRWEPRHQHWRPYYAPPRYYPPRVHYYAPPPVYYAPRPYYRPPSVYFGFGG